jgi:hypothetical protein
MMFLLKSVVVHFFVRTLALGRNSTRPIVLVTCWQLVMLVLDLLSILPFALFLSSAFLFALFLSSAFLFALFFMLAFTLMFRLLFALLPVCMHPVTLKLLCGLLHGLLYGPLHGLLHGLLIARQSVAMAPLSRRPPSDFLLAIWLRLASFFLIIWALLSAGKRSECSKFLVSSGRMNLLW